MIRINDELDTIQITGREGMHFWCDLQQLGIGFVYHGHLESLPEAIDKLQWLWFRDKQKEFVRHCAISELESMQKAYFEEQCRVDLERRILAARNKNPNRVFAIFCVSLAAFCVGWFLSY